MTAPRINIKELQKHIKTKVKLFKDKSCRSENARHIYRWGRWNIETHFIQENNKPRPRLLGGGSEKDIPNWGFHKYKLGNIKTTRNTKAHSGLAKILYKYELYDWCMLNNIKIKKSATYRQMATAIFVAYGEPL